MDITNNKELMETFKEEAQGLIEEMRKDLCDLKTPLRTPKTQLQNSQSGPKTNNCESKMFDLFRSSHTLKGSAPCVGSLKLGEVASVLAEIFRTPNDGKFMIKYEIVSLLSEAVEACERLLNKEEVPGYKELLKRLKVVKS